MRAADPTVRRRYRGYLWPGILILFGLLALLVNTGVVPADRLYRLWDLWPVLLVVLGLAILIQRTALPSPGNLIATGLIILVAIAGAAAYVAAGPALGSASLDSAEPVGELSQVSLHVDVGGASISVKGSDSLGGDLYRAHIAYSGQAPKVKLDRAGGVLEIAQNNSGFFPSQHFRLDLQINTNVSWGVNVNAGGTNETLDLSRVNVAVINLNTGGSSEDITLGQPQGKVSIQINGGGLTVHLHRPRNTATTVQVSGGAVNLTFDGRHHSGIGSVEDGSSGGAGGYDVRISGGGCNVTMDTNAPSG